MVAVDIDGTLLDSSWQLPEENRTAIEEAVACGIEVALVTGRRYEFTREVLHLLPCPLTAIVNNGALVKRSDGTTAWRRMLPRATARRVLEATRDYRDGAGVIFDRPRDGQVVFERIDWSHPSRAGYAHRNRSFVTEIAPLEEALTEDPIQVMFNGRVEPMRTLAAQLRGSQESGEYSVSVTEYQDRDFSLVDVLGPDCTKGRTLLEWAGRQGYRREELLAIGDNLNDLEMLEAAGTAVVMGNAVAELRDRGWAVTASADEAGVGKAIRRWALS